MEYVTAIKIGLVYLAQLMRPRSYKTLRIVQVAQHLLSPARPMTLRHLFYLLISRGIIENSDKEYQNLSRVMKHARLRGELDFDCLVDGLRASIKPSSWSGLEDFADTVRDAYRKDLWASQPDYIEFWFEKDAIIGVVQDITEKYDVKMRPLRGQASLTFLHAAARELSRIGKPKFIYYLGDHDPSGYSIEDAAANRLEELILGMRRADPTPIRWERLALLHRDFPKFRILPLPAKVKDVNYRKFVAQYGNNHAAELDALPPDELRRRVERTILKHIDSKRWRKLQVIEAKERESFHRVMGYLQ